MLENTLMNFLIKSANTPWVSNDLPEITNNDSWENLSYDPDVLANNKIIAAISALRRRNIKEIDAINILKNKINPADWNKFVNDLIYKYNEDLGSAEPDKFREAYNTQNSNASGKVSPIYRGALQSANLPTTSIDPQDAAIDIFNSAKDASNILNYMGELPEVQVSDNASNGIPELFDTPINLQSSAPKKLMSSSHSGPTINIADFNKPYSPEEAQAILSKGLNGGSTSITINPDDFNKIYSPEEALAVTAQGLNGGTTTAIPSSETVAEPAPVVAASAPEPATTTTAPATSSEPVATTPGSTNIPAPTPAPKPVQPASVPVAANTQAVQNPFYDPKSITRQQMRKYRRYTGANDMKSDMDRWKTYQAMNGNRNASNADYYTAKKNNSLGAIKNPLKQTK